ncbi:unnamed protein product [Rhodiola kirilowii]
MGCGSSKLDTLPAVALCRDRCCFLDEAMRLRYNLAEAHSAYMQSLEKVGGSFQRFFDQDVNMFNASPVLTLPGEKKIMKGGGVAEIFEPPPSSSSDISHSHHLVLDSDSDSSSCSHLHLHMDSEEEEEASSESSHHHQHQHHDHQLQGGFAEPQLNAHNVGQFAYPGEFQHEVPSESSNRFMHMSYMKNQAAPSVLYEQKQFSAETGYMDQSLYYNYGIYGHQNAMLSSSQGGYLNYGAGYSSGYYGTAPQYGVSVGAVGSRDDNKSPPPPPSPPGGSAWDFFNPFDGVYYESYSAYPSSMELNEVREEEGIPDLEEVDEEDDYEVVKEVYDKKAADVASGGKHLNLDIDDEGGKVDGVEILSPVKPSLVEDEKLEHVVEMMEAKAVDSEERITKSASEGNTKGAEPRGFSDVLRDIHVQFNRAAEVGNELAELLEVGGLPYHKNCNAYLDSSKMMQAITPSLPIVFSHPSKSLIPQFSSLAVLDASPSNIDEIVGLKTKSLSSTLQKLYLWQKKLFYEVKAEEKMRVLHDRKRRKLIQLDMKGAEADKVISTGRFVRSMGTKIKVAIQVVDRISSTLNKIRDEELWPQINQLIQGLTSMWKSMLECHFSQLQATREVKNLDAVVSHKKFSEANLKASSDLEYELINWALRFSNWVSSQREFAKALNNWLIKCLFHKPEETPDGVAPFSPGRIGAPPPIFKICYHWVQALDQTSEKEVVDAMRELVMSVYSVWERDRLILQQNLVTNIELERQVRSMDLEDHKIRKQIQALEKQVLRSGLPESSQLVYRTDTRRNASVHESLECLFSSMERFISESTKVYEELLQHMEDVRLSSATNPIT